MLDRVLDTPTGAIAVSVLLGLGLAAAFRKVCADQRCIVVQGPPMREVSKYVYKVEDECFRYTPYYVECQERRQG